MTRFAYWVSSQQCTIRIDKAREQNLPNDNIQRAVQRGAGELEGAAYEEIRYEGYGPGGTAIMVDCMTDNRTRTVAEVRHAFTKNGGNLGADGSVAYLFKHCGQFIFAPGTSEEKVMEAGLDAGTAQGALPVGIILDDRGPEHLRESDAHAFGDRGNVLHNSHIAFSITMPLFFTLAAPRLKIVVRAVRMAATTPCD